MHSGCAPPLMKSGWLRTRVKNRYLYVGYETSSFRTSIHSTPDHRPRRVFVHVACAHSSFSCPDKSCVAGNVRAASLWFGSFGTMKPAASEVEDAVIDITPVSPRTGLRPSPRVIPPRPSTPGLAWDCSGHVPKYTRGSSSSSLFAPSPRANDRAAQIAAAQAATGIARKRERAALRQQQLAALEQARTAEVYRHLAESFAGKRVIRPVPKDLNEHLRRHPLSKGTIAPAKSPYYYSFDGHLRATTPRYAPSPRMLHRPPTR